jgi:hypothetical protein
MADNYENIKRWTYVLALFSVIVAICAIIFVFMPSITGDIKTCEDVCHAFNFEEVKECKINSVYCIKKSDFMGGKNNVLFSTVIMKELEGNWTIRMTSYEYIGSHEFADLM